MALEPSFGKVVHSYVVNIAIHIAGMIDLYLRCCHRTSVVNYFSSKVDNPYSIDIRSKCYERKCGLNVQQGVPNTYLLICHHVSVEAVDGLNASYSCSYFLG